MDEVRPTEPICIQGKSNRTEYMRNYMRKQYQSNREFCNERNKSYKIKAKLGISDEEARHYGIHLNSVVKLRKILSKMPPEIFEIALDNI